MTLVYLLAALLLVLGVVWQGFCLWWGARLTKAGRPSYRRALLACLIIQLVTMVLYVGTQALEWSAGAGTTSEPSAWRPLVWAGYLAPFAFAWGCVKRFLGITWRRSVLPTIVMLVGGASLTVPLALGVRHFVEAFFIPTGSMAPTLFGRHKPVECPQCKYPFRVNASSEAAGRQVIAATCPNCRYTVDLGPDNPQGKAYRSRDGDRIMVAKHLYRSADPKRWDVAVFKYPADVQLNYVDRIAGLPKEWIRIYGGDVFVQPLASRSDAPSADGWMIARRPPDTVRAMLQIVHDNDYVAPRMLAQGWPPRWDSKSSGGPGGWVASADHRSFKTDGSAPEEVWICYRHVVPSYGDWQQLLDGTLAEGKQGKPQLITDFFAYNTHKTDNMADLWPEPRFDQMGLHWVGDLAVEAAVTAISKSGELILELAEGGREFQCRIDLSDGKATLSIGGTEGEHYGPTTATAIRGPGTFRVLFANIDDQLILWVDGDYVVFRAGTAYDPLDNTLPTETDLRPVRVGSLGAEVQVDHLRVYRDIYYIAVKADPGGRFSFGPLTDIKPEESEMFHPAGPSAKEMADRLSDPDAWRKLATARRSVEFKLEDGQYFVLGDNSAQSKDGRLWGMEPKQDGWGEYAEHYLSRDLIVGKTLCVYFPRPRKVQ
jgi:signal peptidase I